jgi:hypothetical protein
MKSYYYLHACSDGLFTLTKDSSFLGTGWCKPIRIKMEPDDYDNTIETLIKFWQVQLRLSDKWESQWDKK